MEMMRMKMIMEVDKLGDPLSSITMPLPFDEEMSEFHHEIEFSGGSSNESAMMYQQSQPTVAVAVAVEVAPILEQYSHPLSEKGNSFSSVEAMREMIFRIAAMQPVQIDPEWVKAPRRKNVKISKDPQSVAARHRRERISERIRILQRLVPGGTKMDTASMLDEAVHYMKFLKKQVQSLEQQAQAQAQAQAASTNIPMTTLMGYPTITTTTTTTTTNYSPFTTKACGQPTCQLVQVITDDQRY